MNLITTVSNHAGTPLDWPSGQNVWMDYNTVEIDTASLAYPGVAGYNSAGYITAPVNATMMTMLANQDTAGSGGTAGTTIQIHYFREGTGPSDTGGNTPEAFYHAYFGIPATAAWTYTLQGGMRKKTPVAKVLQSAFAGSGSGTFSIACATFPTQIVTFSPTVATLRSNIQAAYQTMFGNGINGAPNVSVTGDPTSLADIRSLVNPVNNLWQVNGQLFGVPTPITFTILAGSTGYTINGSSISSVLPFVGCRHNIIFFQNTDVDLALSRLPSAWFSCEFEVGPIADVYPDIERVKVSGKVTDGTQGISGVVVSYFETNPAPGGFLGTGDTLKVTTAADGSFAVLVQKYSRWNFFTNYGTFVPVSVLDQNVVIRSAMLK